MRAAALFASVALSACASAERSTLGALDEPGTIDRTQSSALAQSEEELVLALRSNVVAIEAAWPDGQTKDGFGIVIGEEDGTAYIATALHVLRGGPGASQRPNLTVRYYGRPTQATEGEMLSFVADQLDLGVIAAAWPSDLEWENNAFAVDEQSLTFGDPVWFIGRDQDWYVPASEGAFNRASVVNRRLYVDDLPVRIGTSGAPLLSSHGIIGMIIRDASANEAIAVPITDIRAVSLEWGLPWGMAENRDADTAPSIAQPIISERDRLFSRPEPNEKNGRNWSAGGGNSATNDLGGDSDSGGGSSSGGGGGDGGGGGWN